MTAYRVSFDDQVHYLEQKTLVDAQRGAAYLWPYHVAEVRETTAEEYAALIAPHPPKEPVVRHLTEVTNDDQ